MFVKYLIYLTLFQTIKSFESSYEEFAASIHDLIPDQLDELPANQLHVFYNDEDIEPGCELTPYEVRNQPQLFWPYKPNYYYHLIMYDADAQSSDDDSLADFKHWLVGNIPSLAVEQGDHIAKYGGGLPQRNTGYHRYIFMLFESSHKVAFSEPRSKKNSRRNRANYDVAEFCERYGFDGVYAANYFIAQWEPYVDKQTKLVTN